MLAYNIEQQDHKLLDCVANAEQKVLFELNELA